MFQGTGSDVGKSLIVAGLARSFANRGLVVCPFKPQNMSNNAAVCSGGEIGRAQALQALAARVEPTQDMNPVLLKPQSDIGSQVIVKGQMMCNATARDYHKLKPTLMQTVISSFNSICATADLVLIEGAGSPAEINLRDGDIANMGFAEKANVPVVLVGDIERGGVLASLSGTCSILSTSERMRIKGLIVNKFRGDISLFDSAQETLETITGAPLLGVVPWFPKATSLPREDSSSLSYNSHDSLYHNKNNHQNLNIAVLRLPRIANFDDLDPLIAEPGVSLNFIKPGEAIPGNIDLVILPGSKATRADLIDLRNQGWDIDLVAHVRRGGSILGLCGGYQMLGNIIHDIKGIEGISGSEKGLELLDVSTTIQDRKALKKVSGSHIETKAKIYGYEMHMGQTEGPDTKRPWAILEDGKSDGAVSANGKISGTYIHGIFESDSFRHAWIKSLIPEFQSSNAISNWNKHIDTTINDLASHLESAFDIDQLLEIAHVR